MIKQDFREIKFRAYTEYTGMAKVIFIDFEKQDCDIEYIGKATGYPIARRELLKDVELMQFTGLKDKNGKEIYDGDIIQYEKDTFEIVRSEGLAGFTVNFNKKNIKCYPNMNKGTMKYAEVIGNKFDNPELLGVEI